MSVDKWAADYQKFSDNPPAEGTILRCYGGEDARLDIELVEGKPPFVYGRAYVPHIVGMELGWFLQAHNSDSAYGYKCILLPKSREECLRKMGITKKRIRIKALKLVRYSRSKSSILCEVAEYCADSTATVTMGEGGVGRASNVLIPLSAESQASYDRGCEDAKAGRLVPLDDVLKSEAAPAESATRAGLIP